MTLRGAILAAGLLALPVAASAQPVDGFYVSLGAGVNLMQNQDFRITSPSDTPFATGGSLRRGPTARLGSDVGPAVVGSAGYGFGNGLRVELEGDWMNNKFSTVHGLGSGFTSGGFEQKTGVMANVLYDFFMVPYVTPYVGVGAGYQWIGLNNFRINNEGAEAGLSGWQGEFAYQGILGLAVPIPPAPGLAITAEYRFLGTTGRPDFSGGAGEVVDGIRQPGVPIRASIRNNFNHMFLVGFRYNFGQYEPPPPAPVAAPAPAVQPARSYLVFFDWDKSTLTTRARQIIREAAEASTHVQVTRIDVNGYTDTSGTPQYNMGLSIRRAAAVKAELIRNGVPANVITTEGFGDTHLLVPTGPGVREPQNRRVEIILH